MNSQDFRSARKKVKELLQDEPYTPTTKSLLSGFTFESIINLSSNNRLKDNLIETLICIDKNELVTMLCFAFRAGHKDHVYLPGMGHVHITQLMLLIHKANNYFNSL